MHARAWNRHIAWMNNASDMNGRWPNFKYDYAFGAIVALYEKQFPCLFIIHPREYIERGE